jgi:spore maturation protein SpmB
VIFVVGIMVLIKLFQREGVLKGILGLICMLYTFIWGWMHHKEENITNLMYIWSGLWVLGIILNLINATGNA